MKSGKWTALLLSALATGLAMPAAHAGWVTPSHPTGTPVLTTCNPKPFPPSPPSTCMLTGATLLDAVGPGYIQRSSASASIVINGVTVGTLYDRVLCPGSGTTCSSTTYVLAVRVRLNSNAWNGHSSESFEVNDTTRAVLSALSADAAYYMGPPTGSTTSANPDLALANQKWLEYVGRTQYGLNEAMSGTRSNGYMGFRQDYNANDPDGVSSQWSAWLLVRQVCASGVPTTRPNFSIKLWEGGEEAQDHYAQWMAGYKCS